MAINNHSIFVEDDESDCSISTNSTAPSEEQDEYNVERILAEEDDDEGVTKYLVKWEGYPLHRCTWEPRESFVGDSLKNWKRTKRDIQQGLSKPFILQKFYDAVDRENEKREKRSRKREEKRLKKAERRLISRRDRDRNTILKKGIARKASRDSDDSSSPDESISRRESTSLKEFTPNRKRKRAISDSPSPSPDPSVNDVESSQFSLFNESKTTQTTETTSKNDTSKATGVTEKSLSKQSNRAKNSSEQRALTDAKVRKRNATSNAPEHVPKHSSGENLVQAVRPQTTTHSVISQNVSKPGSKDSHAKTGHNVSHAANDPVNPRPPILARSTTAPDLSQAPGPGPNARRASDANSALRPSGSVDKSSAQNKDKGPSLITSASTSNKPNSAPSETLVLARSVGSKPGPARRRDPIKLFIDRNAPRRQRQRVSEYTLKDSTDSQFKNLATRGMFQNYSRNEPAPDPSALTFIDPSTGKPVDAVQGASRVTTDSGALRLDTNMARSHETHGNTIATSAIESRSAFSPQTHSLPSQGPRSAGALTSRSAQTTEGRFAYPSALSTAPLLPDKKLTCRFWYKNGKCRFSDKECRYAHHWTGSFEPKRNQTCEYWEIGRCKWNDEECEFVHGPVEDINDFSRGGRYPDRLTKRRSESPDMGGVRQDEVERRSRISRPNEQDLVASPSLASTASLEIRKRDEVLNSQHLAPFVTTDEAPIFTSNSNHADMLDPVSSSTNNAVSATKDIESHQSTTTFTAELSIKPSDAASVYTTQVRLAFDIKASRTKFLSIVGESPTFKCSEICRSRDFESYWFEKERFWTSGSILYNPEDRVAARIQDFLTLHSAGAVARNDDFVMIIYPVGTPDWKYLPTEIFQGAKLRFYVQATLPDTSELEVPDQLDAKGSRSSFVFMAEKHLDLSTNTIFLGSNNKKLDKMVYLFFPREAPETKLIESYLSDAGAKVFHADDCSLWNQFCDNGRNPNRVVLFHPSMQQYWKIPEFFNVLNTPVNIFQIGVDKLVKSRPEAATKYSCVRLFPTGSMTLITDDIFMYYPQLATRVLQSFEQIVKGKPEGGRNDRMYTRPGLLAWLAQLIDEDHEAGKLTEDSPRIKVWQAACSLMNLSAADTSVDALRPDKCPPPVLYSAPKREMPEYASLWDSNEEDATDYLVQWFCGMCVSERENYRRFTVLFEQHAKSAAQTPGLREYTNPKDPRGWMEAFRHVKVTTPNRWLVTREEYERQKAKARA